MALERRQPLPAGRYWIDVVGPNIPLMEGWLQGAAAAVHVENQHLESTLDPTDKAPSPIQFPHKGPPLLPGPDVFGNQDTPVMWYLWTTSKPLTFPRESLGFPTIAPGSVHTKADTEQRPPVPPGPFDKGGLFNPSGGLGDELEGFGSLAILAALAYFAFGRKSR